MNNNFSQNGSVKDTFVEQPKQHKGNKFNFEKKRQQYTIQIRRKTRQQIFAKKREQPHKDAPTPKQQEDKMSIQLPEAESFTLSQSCIQNQIADPRFQKQIKAYRKVKFDVSMIEKLKAALVSQNILENHYGIIGIRKILSLPKQPPIEVVIQENIGPTLIQYAYNEKYPQLQLEACWSISNIASGESKFCNYLIELGVIPLLIQLLQSKVYGVVEQAVWAIGNVACDSITSRMQIINLGGMAFMIQALNKAKTNYMIQHGAWAISNICRGKTLPDFTLIQQGIFVLAIIVAQNRIKDKQILSDCCWAIAYNTQNESSRINMIINSGLVYRIPDLLSKQNMSIKLATLRITGRIALGSFDQVDVLMKQKDILEILTDTLMFPKEVIRAEACWVLQNMAASSSDHTQSLTNNQKLAITLINLLQTDTLKVRTQICHLFSNLTIDSDPHIILNYYQQYQIIPHFMFQFKENNNRFIKDIMGDLFTVMIFGESFRIEGNGNPIISEIMSCQGNTTLEQLQQSDDQEIFEDISNLLLTFFNTSEHQMEQQ